MGKLLTHHPWLASVGRLVLLLVILCSLAYLFQDRSWRWDCTEEKQWTLAPVTLETLKNLDKPVKVRFYYSRNVPQMPVKVKRFAKRVQDMLNEYEKCANGRIQLEMLNPQPDSELEEAAILDGMVGRNAADLGTDGQLYFGIAVSCDGVSSCIPALHPQREALLEYDITRILLEAVRQRRRVLGVISALPVNGKPILEGGKHHLLPPWHLISELGKQYQLEMLPVNGKDIPPYVEALLVIHPKGISREMLQAIDRYVVNGGRMAAYLDPLCMAELQLRLKGDGSYMVPDATSAISELTKAWGVQFTPTYVLLDRGCAATIRFNASEAPETILSVLSLGPEQIASEAVATTSVSSLLLYNSGAFRYQEKPGLRYKVLLQSTADSQLVERYATQRKSADLQKDFVSDNQQRILALEIQGIFPSAFAVTNAENKEGRVVLVGDADMLYDPFCVKRTEEVERVINQPLNHNLVFAQNVLEWMTGDTRLAQIRSRGIRLRPFVKVEQMARKAEHKYQVALEQLSKELEAVTQEIYGAQGKTTGEKTPLITREQRQAVEAYRLKEAVIRNKLKTLRKQMRSEVERLENRVIWMNMCLVPFCVACLGVAVVLSRSYRRR